MHSFSIKTLKWDRGMKYVLKNQNHLREVFTWGNSIRVLQDLYRIHKSQYPFFFFRITHCYIFGETESCSVASDSLRPHGPYSPWNSPGQNSGVGSLSLFQGIFPTQGSNPGLLHCRLILYQLSHKGSPKCQQGRGNPDTNQGPHYIFGNELWILISSWEY